MGIKQPYLPHTYPESIYEGTAYESQEARGKVYGMSSSVNSTENEEKERLDLRLYHGVPDSVHLTLDDRNSIFKHLNLDRPKLFVLLALLCGSIVGGVLAGKRGLVVLGLLCLFGAIFYVELMGD